MTKENLEVTEVGERITGGAMQTLCDLIEFIGLENVLEIVARIEPEEKQKPLPSG